ncbi:MAG: hypothetical protein KDD11_21925, partial [Acidobacteria bacterium]|nr:hypothetical protein [Acidobacteriota bacterium]
SGLAWPVSSKLPPTACPGNHPQPVRTLPGAHWSSRDGHASAVFKDRLWVLGGWDRGGLSDVWSSPDGDRWRQEPIAPWPRRKAHTAAVFHDRLWVLGGSLGVEQTADVWSTEDGQTWRQDTERAPWGPRNNHAVVVFHDRIWVLGGWGAGPTEEGSTDAPNQDGRDLDDVWWSDDGQTWHLATDHAAWSPRNGHAATVFKDKLWVLGGWGEQGDGSEGNLADAWWSDDGQSWHRTDSPIPWSPRNGHAAIAFADRLWLIGGWGPTHTATGQTTDGNLSDVWWTQDGITWHPATSQASWLPRNGHTLEVFKHRLWLIGGWSEFAGKKGLNDLWWVGSTDRDSALNEKR